MLLNNLPISAHVSIKINAFMQKNIFYIYTYVDKSWENCLCQDKYLFSSCVSFLKMLGKITRKK